MVVLIISLLSGGILCGGSTSVFTFASPTPVVIWHGMGDSCCNPLSIGSIKKLIEQKVPQVYIRSLEIGNSVTEDMWNSFFMNANKQVDYVCSLLKNDTKLSDGYNAIGFSQGAQFLRAVIQRCPGMKPKTLISVGGQHQGVYGMPKCVFGHFICEAISHLLDHGVYTDVSPSPSTRKRPSLYRKTTPWRRGPFWEWSRLTIKQALEAPNSDPCTAYSQTDHERTRQATRPHSGNLQCYVQNALVQAQYWHDPLNETEYRLKSLFLADINNERTINEEYKRNLMSLENFVMVKFLKDTMVVPPETEWFGFYKPGQAEQIQAMNETVLYKQDRLGLAEMNVQDKLKFLSFDGEHLQFSETWFIDNIIMPYLSN